MTQPRAYSGVMCLEGLLLEKAASGKKAKIAPTVLSDSSVVYKTRQLSTNCTGIFQASPALPLGLRLG